MSPNQDFEDKEQERKVRRRVFCPLLCNSCPDRGRTSDLEVERSRRTNHRWRVVGLFIPSCQRAI